MTDPWMDRLSEYLDGELAAAERKAVEAHLVSCARCRALLGDLQLVVDHARLVEHPGPARDLWPGIAARIGATPPVVPRTADLASRRQRRWSFSLPQLAAAAVLLIMLSGGSVWVLRSPPTAPARITTAPVPVGAGSPAAVNASTSASQSYTAAVADLEQVLARGRGQLDTATVRVIQENLAAIDRAIAQAQQALAADPANLYLNTHLAETMRRKLDLLRQAATLVHTS
ncbi:MAG TPA: zf-HC2 domain-containing protein [Gemmatimonadales bacterium]|nr:zf-HC2 domain-containing protein [Gemmatimonadales bacterium]